MSLCAQAQSLDALEQLPSSHWVQGSTHISEHIDSGADGESDWTESIPELETVESWRWLNHLWESLTVLAPVELSRIDDDTANGCAMTSDPFSCGVNDDICSVVDRTNKVTASAEGVVNLIRLSVL
jgi:hypothetical protein